MKTIHIFKCQEEQKVQQQKIQYLSFGTLNRNRSISQQNPLNQQQVEEESKMSEFFRKFKEKVLPQSLICEGSSLRIHLDQELLQDKPYSIYFQQNSTILNIITWSGYYLKYSLDPLFNEIELFNQSKVFKKDEINKNQNTQVVEGILRMKIKIKEFFIEEQENNYRDSNVEQSQILDEYIDNLADKFNMQVKKSLSLSEDMDNTDEHIS